MLSMSVKVKYGLCVMVELAKSYNDKPLRIPFLAEIHSIPQTYLEQVFAELKRSGFVISFRGAHGGYSLSRSPEEINISSIVEMLEGPLELVSGQKGCDQMLFFWEDVEEKIKSIFNLTLADLLVKQELHKQKMQKMLTYSI